MKALVPMVLVGLAMSGCHDLRATRDRGAAGLSENTPLYPAPKVNRCARFGKGSGVGKHCDDAKYLAEVYVRRLSTSDEVCLEGGFGEAPGGACLARASVADVATDRVLLEVRTARPDSKWFQQESNQVWFEEGALVDLYLAERGY